MKHKKELQVIAFYLPQYHPTPHNDVWWGKGFTEWTNVGKAKKLFLGHYQPKVPADLGYYDLRMPEIREQQAELAKKAGITGFCYYHYWFGNGEQELELPFNEVVESGKPDFPFCLCWANHSWSRKIWNRDGNVVGKDDLIIQKYPGVEDDESHFYNLLTAFKDSRYIKIDGKPLFMVFSPMSIPNVKNFILRWNELAKENGLNGLYFVAYSLKAEQDYNELKQNGFDAICSCRLGYGNQSVIMKYIRKGMSVLFGLPRIFRYKSIYPQFVTAFERDNNDVYPTMIPNWDHTPRSKKYGYLYLNANPQLFYKHAVDVLRNIKNKKDRICFIKSWNEWGEGNYMEPDLKYGHGYIDALKRAITTVFDF